MTATRTSPTALTIGHARAGVDAAKLRGRHAASGSGGDRIVAEPVTDLQSPDGLTGCHTLHVPTR
jgi:hypothetical protein